MRATCRSPSTTAMGRLPMPSGGWRGRCCMSPSRPDILASRGAARPLQRLEAHLAGGEAQAPALREVPLVDLWLRHQPRKLVPDSVLDALLAVDRAQPAALLAELERLAADTESVHATTLRS